MKKVKNQKQLEKQIHVLKNNGKNKNKLKNKLMILLFHKQQRKMI